MNKKIFAALMMVFILSGCSVRSISDSGYKEGRYYGHRNDNPFYKGELSGLIGVRSLILTFLDK